MQFNTVYSQLTKQLILDGLEHNVLSENRCSENMDFFFFFKSPLLTLLAWEYVDKDEILCFNCL